MTNKVRSPYSAEQMAVWLRGLLTIAWADGLVDEDEQCLIASLMDEENIEGEPISAIDLAAGLGADLHIRENFLRTAVMVAIADGAYSISEARLIQQFSDALGLAPALLKSLHAIAPETALVAGDASLAASHPQEGHPHHDPLHTFQDWLDQVDVHDPRLARFLCRLIPPQCPFERDVNLFGRRVAHIPPLCKLNPLYEQLVGLRFRALSYLADECHEDVTRYC